MTLPQQLDPFTLEDNPAIMVSLKHGKLPYTSEQGNRGSWTRVLEKDISYTRGQNFHLGTSLRQKFHDEYSVPECKKYHTLAHKFKNLFLPRPIDK